MDDVVVPADRRRRSEDARGAQRSQQSAETGARFDG